MVKKSKKIPKKINSKKKDDSLNTDKLDRKLKRYNKKKVRRKKRFEKEEEKFNKINEKDIREDVKDVMYKRSGIKRKDILNIQKSVTFIFLSVMLIFLFTVYHDFKSLENPFGREYDCVNKTYYEYAPNDFSVLLNNINSNLFQEISIKSYLVLYEENNFYSTYATDDFNNTLRLYDVTSGPYTYFTKDIPTNETFQVYGVFRRSDKSYGINVIEIRRTEKQLLDEWSASECSIDETETELTFSNYKKYLMYRIRKIIS